MPTPSNPSPMHLDPRTMRRVLIGALSILLLTVLALLAPAAIAQGAPMPFASGLCQLAGVVSGPLVRYAAVIAVVILGVMIAFGEVGSMFKNIATLLVGLSVALAAVSWIGYWTGITITMAC